MKLSIVLAMCLTSLAYGAPQGKYTDKWDSMDIEEILESQRILKAYTNCLMDRGRCTPDGKTLKEVMPEALQNGCSKCTEKQMQGATNVIRGLKNMHPEIWDELRKKYDPENKYGERYEDALKNIVA